MWRPASRVRQAANTSGEEHVGAEVGEETKQTRGVAMYRAKEQQRPDGRTGGAGRTV